MQSSKLLLALVAGVSAIDVYFFDQAGCTGGAVGVDSAPEGQCLKQPDTQWMSVGFFNIPTDADVSVAGWESPDCPPTVNHNLVSQATSFGRDFICLDSNQTPSNPERPFWYYGSVMFNIKPSAE